MKKILQFTIATFIDKTLWFKCLGSRIILLVALTHGSTIQLLHAQSKLWGVGELGGSTGAGMIYSTNSDGTGFSIQKDLIIDYPGSNPVNQPVLAPNGKLYGITNKGGTNNAGVLFEYDPTTGTYTKKVDFTMANGLSPTAGLMLASNGKLYGVTQFGGSANTGVLFEFDPNTGIYNVRWSFIRDATYHAGDIINPVGNLMQSTDGWLYGMSYSGGVNGFGGIYKYDLGTSVQTSYSFTSTYSLNSLATNSLVQAANGKLYGMCPYGGSAYSGILFEFDPTIAFNNFNIEVNFSASNGSSPYGGLLLATDGKLYGMTNNGGVMNGGTLFQFDPASSVFVKEFDFNYVTGSGQSPYGDLMQASNGKLYGMNSYLGGIFEYNLSTGAYILRNNFSSINAGNAQGGLTQAGNGKLYGMTLAGPLGNGVFFEFDVNTGGVVKKFDFSSSTSGKNPMGKLTRGFNGKFYGTTALGGLNNFGTLFEFDPSSGVYTKKIDFATTTTGSTPNGSLVQATNAKLYGMTRAGGANSYGVIFEYDPSNNTLTKKFDFTSAAGGGYMPYGGLIQTANGKFYGMTKYGGTNNGGVIFEFDISSGSLVKKTDLGITTTGGQSQGDLLEATNGKLYGLTYAGGPTTGGGTIFEFDTGNGNFVVKYEFSLAGGFRPYGNLTQASNGKLYGACTLGGGYNTGIIFEFDLTNNTFFKVDVGYSPSLYGSTPIGSLTISNNGKFYGVTSGGGVNGNGVLFEYDRATNTYTNKQDFAAPASYVYGNSSLLLDVIKIAQTITFNALPIKTYGDPSFNPATASSGLPISYSSSDPSVATGGNTITIVGAGTATITATQPGNASYYPATPVPQTLIVNKAALTASSNASKIYGSVNPSLSIAYSGFIGSDNSGVIDTAPTASTTATQFSNTGAYTITVSGGLDNNYLITDVNGTLTIIKANPTISFTSANAGPYGGTIMMSVNKGGSTGTDSYTETNGSGSASITNPNQLNLTGGGTVTVTATVAADANYNAGTANQTVTINKVNPTISFTSASSGTFGGTISLSVNKGGSTGADTYTETNGTGSASITNKTLSLNGAGQVTVTATVAADANYNAGTANQTVTINKANPSVSFTSPNSGTYGATINMSVNTGGSTGTVSYSVSNGTGSATVSGSTLSLTGGGWVTAIATVAADANYNAGSANQTVTINQASQSISFSPPPPTSLCGVPSVDLHPNASSGLGVSISVTGPASMSGYTLIFTDYGPASITASQGGNNNYLPANNNYQSVKFVSTNGSITQSGHFCLTGIMNLSIAGGFVGSWSTGQYANLIQVYETGTYSASYNDSGCTIYVSTYVASCGGGGGPHGREASDSSDSTHVDNNYKFGIYPNPANDHILVVLSAPAELDCPVQMYDMLGRLSKTDVIEKGLKEKTIHIENLEPGIYVVNIQDNKRTRQRKMIIQRK